MNLKSKKNIIIFVTLLAVFGVIGTQYQAVYGSSTGVYWIEKTNYQAGVGESISVTGKVWITESGTYKVGYMTPDYGFNDGVVTKTFGTVSTAGYWTWTVNVPVTKYGTYDFYAHLPNGNLATGSKTITVQAPPTTEEPPTAEEPTKPSDRCEGTTKVTHYLSNNVWKPSYSYNSPECGYAEPITTGSLFVDANPDGSLTIDGIERGNTPTTVDGLSIGPHIISVQLSGYKEAVKQVTVNTGTNYEILYLEKATADEQPTPEPQGEGTPTSENKLLTVLLAMIVVVMILSGAWIFVRRG